MNETRASTNNYYGGTSAEQAVAFGILIFGCLCFGTMFLPLRRYNCGDGFFVQFVECSAVFVYGFVILLIRKVPRFNLISSIGGALYATGNVASVPIIQSELGVGLGMLIWTTVQIIEGWCIGRFGLFGTHVQKVSNEPMNYIGLVLSILSGLLFIFVRSASLDDKQNKSFMSKKKLFYIGLSIFLGCVHGMMLTPIIYVKENDKEFTGNVLDYIFSFFCGAFLFSTLYFVIYCIIKRNKPFMSPEIALPSIAYGILWATGMTSFIVSTSTLSQTISWPMTARLPAIIGVLIDVFVFKTIKGKRNFIILATGVSVCIIGVVLVGLSNQI